MNRTARCRAFSTSAQPLDAAKHDRSSGVVIGDVNGDSKLDVVISNETTGGKRPADRGRDQTNYLYLNTTTDAEQRVFGAAIALDAWEPKRSTRAACLLIDVEGDGDLDLVATAANNHPR